MIDGSLNRNSFYFEVIIQRLFTPVKKDKNFLHISDIDKHEEIKTESS